MKEHSIEIHEVSLSKVDGSELKAPMIPPSRYQRSLNVGECIPDWAMSIDYASKTTRHSRTTFLKSDGEDEPETKPCKGERNHNEFAEIGEAPEAHELSEIKLDHKEGG